MSGCSPTLKGLELREHVWPKFLRENALAAFKLD